MNKNLADRVRAMLAFDENCASDFYMVTHGSKLKSLSMAAGARIERARTAALDALWPEVVEALDNIEHECDPTEECEDVFEALRECRRYAKQLRAKLKAACGGGD